MTTQSDGNWKRELWAGCGQKQVAAMQELENRGLSFCSHFGTENATQILSEMDEAANCGNLYGWMQQRFGL